jgi:hypothetical protein
MRSFFFLLTVLLACGPSSIGQPGGQVDSMNETTFCAVLRVARTRCASGGASLNGTDVSLATCAENRLSCEGLTAQAQVTSNEQTQCVTTTTFELSQLNEHGPFPGTCTEYEAWRTGQQECLASTTDAFGNPVACQHGVLRCGATPFGQLLNGPPPPEHCRGLEVVIAQASCENQSVISRQVVRRTCTHACVEKDAVAWCDANAADAGSPSAPDAGSPPPGGP